MAATSGATHLASAITGLFDAIRTKASVSGSMTFAEAASVVENIPAGGGGGDGLTTVQKLVNGWALPVVPQEDADAVTVIPSRGFYNCTTLTTASFPACTVIKASAFYSCPSLISVDFPACTTIGSNAFRTCSALTTANFPVCTAIGSAAFASCSALTMVNFPSLSSIPGGTRTVSGAFSNCSALTMISLPACRYIGSSAFQGCTSLMSLYLMGNSVASLANVTAFTNTPLSAGGSGTIYVPSSLWPSYQVARNWSTLSSKIVSM